MLNHKVHSTNWTLIWDQLFFFVVHMWLTVRMVRLHTAPPLFLTQFWMLLTLLPRMRMVRTLFHWLIVLCNFYMLSTVCLHHPTHSLTILSISSSIIVTSTSCPPSFPLLPLPPPHPLPGKSDPFCRLGILPFKYQSSHQVKHKNLESWQKEGIVKDVVTTTVRPATLTPEWGEHFEL